MLLQRPAQEPGHPSPFFRIVSVAAGHQRVGPPHRHRGGGVGARRSLPLLRGSRCRVRVDSFVGKPQLHGITSVEHLMVLLFAFLPPCFRLGLARLCHGVWRSQSCKISAWVDGMWCCVCRRFEVSDERDAAAASALPASVSHRCMASLHLFC